MTTAGEAAFDESTRAHLSKLRANPVDCFGQRIDLSASRAPLVRQLGEGPQRAALLAVRLQCGRRAVDEPLAALVNTGQAQVDAEGFYTLGEAFGP